MEENPDKLLAMIRGLRSRKDLDPEEILAVLTEARALLPAEYRGAVKPRPETTSRLDAVLTEEDFLWDAAQEAVESLLAEVQAVVQAKRENLMEKALDLYYRLEEAARDPANAHLLPQLEELRKAYERDRGHPIPTREETEARRRGK